MTQKKKLSGGTKGRAEGGERKMEDRENERRNVLNIVV